MATAPKSEYPPEASGQGENEAMRKYWSEQIAKADKRWDTFRNDGDQVIARFMLESNRNVDRYNILYSSTETIKPSLYGQTPKVQAQNRQVDTEQEVLVYAAMLLENVGQYCVDMVNFDYVMQCCVSDYTLPGMGNVWVRYDAKFANDNGSEYKSGEDICLDYVHFKDWMCGEARYWDEVPWVSRRVYFTKNKAIKRFGRQKALKLTYSFNAQGKANDGKKEESDKKQAVIYEIWDKDTMKVYWFSEDYPDGLLDERDDPLKLQDFWPCPRPLRAVWATKSFIPKALYSQYKPQAAELDRLTERIRFLTEALKVRGLYDGSQPNLANVLEGAGNKMIPVQDWAAFMGQNGVQGSVQWVPLQEIVNCLTELFKQREICKNEIYEITGFSDILRGLSKASETLGAQQIKADWGGSRLKDMQREVQRFCRDIIRIFVEIAAEQFNDKTLALYGGFVPPEPTPEEIQMQQMAAQQGQPPPPTQAEQAMAMFKKVVAVVRKDKLRCAAVGVETDSTILPDEQKERTDRMQFLSSMGAFLQQAGPMALQFPDMRGLLGAIMMFTLRTFSASRPLEKEFESFQKKLEAAPPQPPPGQGNDGKAQAEATTNAASIKAKADSEKAVADNNLKKYEIDQKVGVDKQKNQQDHDYRMAQLALERQRLDLERQKLGLGVLAEERTADTEREDREYERLNAERDRESAETERMDNLEASEADRAAAEDQRLFDQEARETELDQAQQALDKPPEKANK